MIQIFNEKVVLLIENLDVFIKLG